MNRNTWIIVGLVAVLAAAYFLTKNDKVSVGMKRLELPNIDIDKVDKIELSGKNEAVLVKKDGQWFLELSMGENKKLVLADAKNVLNMLNAAVNLKPSYYVTEIQEKYKDLGLGEDQATKIQISAQDKTLWALSLGNNAANNLRYAKLPNSNEVYAVKAVFWQLVRNNAVDWRRRNLWQVQESDVDSFTIIRNGKTHLAFSKKSDKPDWFLQNLGSEADKSFRVNETALASLVNAGLTLRATSFIDDLSHEANQLLEQEPWLKLLVKTKDGQELFLSAAKGPEDKVWAKMSDGDQIYELAEANFSKINKEMEELRDLTINKLEKSEVVKISLSHKNKNILLEKKDDAWELLEPSLPADFVFDQESPNDLLSVVGSLTGERLADAKLDLPQDSAWQKKPVLELFMGQNESIKIYLGKIKGKDEYLVKGNIDENIYVVSSYKIEAINAGLETFRKVEMELPPIDENTRGFESLPVDVQRKLLDATKNK